jgi:Xaa-Pro dipeptidase
MNVDFEERVDFARLRQHRLRRALAALEASDLGALLVFDNNNIRYLTGVSIGEWTRDKLCRYALYTRTGELYLWDFGSAAVHHRMYCPWLKPENCIASYTTMRGAVPPDAHIVQLGVAEIRDKLAAAGVAGQPVGVDFTELPMLFELQRQGVDVRDGQQVMLDARQIKSSDEIALLATAAAMVDGVYQDITEVLKPGVRENEIVALANKRLYEMGSDDVESINAVSGERCNPHPHNFSDRMIRPGEQAFFDIMHSFTATGPATTGPSASAGRTRRSAMRTSGPGSGWIPPSRSSSQGSRPIRWQGSGRPQATSAWPTRRRPSACSSGTGSVWRCTSAR